MPREFNRWQRVADLIQRELAVLIQKELKDPRIGMVTINEVKVSRDLAYADIYFTMLPEDRTNQGVNVLHNAAGFLRSQLAKVLVIRSTPRLRFHHDQSVKQGAKMADMIHEAIKRDAMNRERQENPDG